jgi:cytochrome b6-f complex iron-sulfur subunit
MEDESASRRSFLGKLLGGSLLVGMAAVIGSAIAYLFPSHDTGSRLGPQQVKVGKATDIPRGKGKLALVNEEPVWVVHLARGFEGYAATCTHKGCIIEWEEKRGVFTCPCHQGLFDAHGNVIAGLPRRPLPHFQVGSIQGDIFVLSRRPMAQEAGGSSHRLASGLRRGPATKHHL